MDARVRCGRARARPAGADRRRPDPHPPGRDLDRPARRRVPRLVGADGGRSRGRVEPAGRGRPVDLAGDRHRHRRHGLVDPARRGLHALRAYRARRVLGDRRRLLRPGRAPSRTRGRGAPHAGRGRRGLAPCGGRGRGHRRAVRAPRPHRRRDGRGVRERVLRRGLAAEPRAPGTPAPPHRADDHARNHRSARARADELPVLPLPARVVLRPVVRRAARGLARGRPPVRAGGRVRRRAVPGRADRGLDRRVRHLPVALPDRAGVVGRPGRAARAALRGGSGRRCRASPCRSSSPSR